jgi:hypothetical protein
MTRHRRPGLLRRWGRSCSVSESKPADTVHLVATDEMGRQGDRPVSYVTVCGELVRAANLVAAGCPPDCECDHRYCLVCVRAAIRWSTELELTLCPPGVVVQIGSAPSG